MDNFINNFENNTKESNILIISSIFIAIIIYSQFPDSSYLPILMLVLSNIVIYINQSNTKQVNNITQNIEEKLNYLNLVLEETNLSLPTVNQLRFNNIIEGTESSQVNSLKSYLHTDPNLVLFLYSIRDFEKYSKFSYSKLLKNVNILLKLKNDFQYKTPDNEISLQDTSTQLKVAQRFYNLSMNYYHSFIYSIPNNTVVRQKYQEGMYRLRVLLKRILRELYKISRIQLKKKGIDINTDFIGFEFDGIKEYDENQVSNPFNYIYT
jgi:hypothetical protein